MATSSILIGLLLLGASVVVVSLPFQKKPRKEMKAVKAQAQIAERRTSVISALRELDFDFKTGKVSEEDYTPLRAKLMMEAAQYIEQEKNEADKLEALIQSRRVLHQHSAKCEKCGAILDANQSFCAKCGTAVNQESCPKCGKRIRAGDFFCTSCGASLPVKKEAAVLS